MTSVGNVHSVFFGQDAAKASPISQVQRKTLDMNRERLSEGLWVAGIPNRQRDFAVSELSLGVLAEIEDAYTGNYEDPWGWRHVYWFRLTKGQEVAISCTTSDLSLAW